MRRIPAYLLMLLALVSCRFVSSVLHDEEVVAEVGDMKLYRPEVEKFIPGGVSAEDSARFASQYIRMWALEQLYQRVAAEQLSPEEMDVSEEIENYRRSLLKYRYEQRYINDRLDTLVTEDQINAYYEEHKADFQLKRPVLKVRFADILKSSPAGSRTIAMLRSDNLTTLSAIRWFDSSQTWMDASDLALEFDMGWKEMLSNLKGDYIRVEPKDGGNILVAYVVDMVRSGCAPIDYVAPDIKEKIISLRKHELASGLEQDLLEDALERKILEIR